MSIRIEPLDSLFDWVYDRRQTWLPPLIILGVLVLSAFLGLSNRDRLYQAVLVLIPGTVAVLVFFRWPPVGLLALLGSIAIPFSGPSHSNLTMAIAAMLIGLWIVDMVLRQRKVELISSITIPPAIALVIVATLAFGFGLLPWYTFAQHAPLGAQLAGLMLYILSVGVFLVSAHQVQEVRWLKWLVFLFLGIGTVAVVGRLGPASLGESINTLLFHANGSLLWMWLLTITASQGLFNKDLHPIWRVGLGLLFLATLYIMLTEFWAWNSGWMPAVASVGTIIFVALPWSRLPIILGGLVVVATKLQSLYDKIMVGDNAYSLSTRLDAWTIVLEIAKVNPILGLGPANYYYYTPLFPIRGYAVQFNSHQQYVDLIAQTGILGLVGFVWFFVAVGWVAWQIRNTVPEGFAQAYVFGAIGGVVGTLVSAAFGDWVIPFFYNVTLGGFRSSMLSWLFFGGLLALQQIYLPNISSKQSN